MNSLLVAVCLALFAVACASTFAQSAESSTKPTKPITLKGLEDAIKIGGLQDSELIGKIQSRGVNFILTSQITDTLRGLGASAAVIQAAGANYRATAAPNANTVAPALPHDGTGQSGSAHVNPSAPTPQFQHAAPAQPRPAQQGILHYQGPPVPYGGTVVFDNLPKLRLKFSFDGTAWRMVIRINPDGTKKVILSSLKQGYQSICDLGWEIVGQP